MQDRVLHIKQGIFSGGEMGKDFLNRFNIIKSVLNMIKASALACMTVFLFSSQALAGIVESGEPTEASRWITQRASVRL